MQNLFDAFSQVANVAETVGPAVVRVESAGPRRRGGIGSGVLISDARPAAEGIAPKRAAEQRRRLLLGLSSLFSNRRHGGPIYCAACPIEAGFQNELGDDVRVGDQG
jgi:hypothetical protein